MFLDFIALLFSPFPASNTATTQCLNVDNLEVKLLFPELIDRGPEARDYILAEIFVEDGHRLN
jgi:hypothetical protein